MLLESKSYSYPDAQKTYVNTYIQIKTMPQTFHRGLFRTLSNICFRKTLYLRCLAGF